jgi:DNA-binding NarL/FixJ family response regulator
VKIELSADGTEYVIHIPRMVFEQLGGVPFIPRDLPQRQREVLGLILQGWQNKQIADRLGICTRTVKFHVSELLRRFRVDSRWELPGVMAKPASEKVSTFGLKAAEPTVRAELPLGTVQQEETRK